MSLYLQLTYNCNLRCGHCYLSSKLGQPEEFSLIEEVVRFLKKYRGIKRIVIHGGEPTLLGLDRIKHILGVLPGMALHFQTNLVALPEEELGRWAELFFTYTAGRIGTSMDAYRIVWYDLWKSRVIGLKKRGVTITALVTLTKDNDSFYEELIRFCFKEGVRIKFQFEYRSSYDRDYLDSVEALTNHLLESIVKNDHLSKKDLYRTFSIGKRTCCNVFTVSPDGHIYACPTLSGIDKFKIGHLLDESLRIEDSSAYGYFVNYYRHAARTCDRDCWSVCYGGCPANATTVSGSKPETVDPYCKVKKNLIRRIRNVSRN